MCPDWRGIAAITFYINVRLHTADEGYVQGSLNKQMYGSCTLQTKVVYITVLIGKCMEVIHCRWRLCIGIS